MPLTALATRDDAGTVALGAKHLLRDEAHDVLEPDTQDDAFTLAEFTSHKRPPRE